MSETTTTVETTGSVGSSVASAVPIGTQEWFQVYGKYLIGGIIGIAAIVAGVIFYTNSQSAKEEEAALALSRIKSYVEANDYQKALDGDPSKKVRNNDILGLRQIVDEYGGTDAGKTAALLAGNCSVALKKNDDAVSYFEKAEDSESELVVIGAKAGLAGCFEASGKTQEAAELYSKIAEMAEKTGGKDRYLLYAGLCYEKLGTKDKAEQCYRNLLNEFEFSEFSSDAKAGLVRLGMVVE